VSDIKAGDLVVVVRECCQTQNLGRIDTVMEIMPVDTGTCTYCGLTNGHKRIAVMPEMSAPLAWLIKLDPPALHDSTKHSEEIPA
jgi:hypothetical protein